jgi:hypothetical protein
MCTPSVAVIAAEARDLQPRYRDESMLNFRWRLWSGPGSFIHARLFRCYPLFNVWPPGTARPRHGPRRSGQHGRAYPRAGPQAQARPYNSRAVPAWRHDEPTVPGPAQARLRHLPLVHFNFARTVWKYKVHQKTMHKISASQVNISQYHKSNTKSITKTMHKISASQVNRSQYHKSHRI